MATIKDVAARAAVSLGTVSNVIAGSPRVNADLRRRVEKAIAELGYRPNIVARSLKTKQTRTIGMVLSDLTNPFFPLMASGAEAAARRHGYLLTMFNTGDSPDVEKQVFETLEARRVDGLLVVVALHRGDHPHLRRAIDSGTPVVCLDRRPEDILTDTVGVDNRAGMRLAVDHLIALGHRRIGFIGGARGMYIARERAAGYRDAVRTAHLPALLREGDFRAESGRRRTLELLEEKVTALAVGNLLMTLGALRALKEVGRRVPEDMSLAAFDCLELLDSFHPRLTAVEQPTAEIGYRGAELLIERIEGRAPGSGAVDIQLATRLRVGESTARASE